MADDDGYYSFCGFRNLFVLFMLMLVLANNDALLFVGWEGVGLCSYLLIGFYFQKKSAGDAGKKAFVVNRVGDAGFIIGMLMLLSTVGTLRFTDVNAVLRTAAFTPETAGIGTLTIITLCMFFGATGKSAQFPLYIWLPDAMERPTPVSALIHPATMVTAGVYMGARSSALFELTPITSTVVASIGAFTAILAATILRAVCCTPTAMPAFYMRPIMDLTFYGASRVAPEVASHVHESPASMTIPLTMLAIGSVLAGWLGVPKLWTVFGESFRGFERWLEPVFATAAIEAVKEHEHSASIDLTLMFPSISLPPPALLTPPHFHL